MAGIKVEGNTGIVVDVDAANHMKVALETNVTTAAAYIGGARRFSENDQGLLTGVIKLSSPETDADFRERVALDTLLDDEAFSYTAQNTGKLQQVFTTMVSTFTAGTLTLNSGSITTTTTGITYSTYAFFPSFGAHVLSADTTVGFSAQPTANTFVEWGCGILGGATVAPTDGVFFRLSSGGLQGIASNNGTETSTGIFPLSNGTGTWVYTNNKRYQFIVYNSATSAEFWVNDGVSTYQLGAIPLPSGQHRMQMAQAAPYFMKQRITGGAAGAALQALFGGYSVRIGGSQFDDSAASIGNRVAGAYQGLSGGTMGSLANYVNNTNPTPAVPANASASLGTGLGGQFWETATLAVNTDGIIQSYQVPVGTATVPGKRLVIRGVSLASYIQAVVVGGPFNCQWSLAWGHTSVSLATAETALAKAPRRKALPAFTQLVTTAQAAATMVAQSASSVDFSGGPIYVNPGEFVALVTKHVGTVASAGTIAHQVDFVYGWE